MVEYFDLGGKKRPLLYGSAAFKMLKQRTNMGMMKFLGELGTGEPDVISDITYCALRIGERAEKLQPVDEYDEMDVAMWIDQAPGGVAAFMQKLVDSLPKPQAGEGDEEPGEAQTTGIGTNSKLAQAA